MTITISIATVQWEMNEPFAISRGVVSRVEAVLVTLVDAQGNRGRGEGYGIGYEGETCAIMQQQLAGVARHVRAGATREELLELLPHGGARCALDCAMWDLEAKRSGRPAWALAGLSEVHSLTTAMTIGIRSPDALRVALNRYGTYPLLKIKVGADEPLETLRTVREMAPRARLIVDPNQAWTFSQLREYAPVCRELGVELIEQPLPVTADEDLRGYSCPVALCADEAVHTRADLPAILGKYQCINIKLDKTGGLTEALLLERQARAAGLSTMVGCMWGSSLAMAPGFILGQFCDFVDLDGPLLQKTDWPDAISYNQGYMSAPRPSLWG
ncbi:MAG TPA: dipeptide epimerase [Steroidobacter sp.]|uniref:dipeptide epimerase n=1 Tax=Steroidobacter sp. TaxID=1978227 RepID=UPI002ED7DEC1